MLSDPIIKEVILQAPVEKVWKALTDKEDMKKWYFDIKEFKPEVGSEFSFLGEKDGRKFVHLSRITNAEVNKKLSYTWRYEDQPAETLVTFELFPEGNKTRLKLTHEGLEKLPQDEDFAKENFEQGWDHIIGKSIKEFVEK